MGLKENDPQIDTFPSSRLPPSEAENYLQALIRAGYKIPGVTGPPTGEMVSFIQFFGQLPDVLQVRNPTDGQVVLLPFYAALAARRLMQKRTVILQRDLTHSEIGESGWGYSPRPIFPDEKDPAVEKGITLFELTQLLEKQRVRKKPNRAVVLGLVPEDQNLPEEDVFWTTMSFIGTRLIGEIHYYDYLALYSYPKHLPDHVTHPVYPLPPFLERTFNIPHPGPIKVFDLAAFFLREGYADRVILLPRIRVRGLMLEDDFLEAAYELSARFPLGQRSKAIWAEGFGELSRITTEELKEARIPVLERADLERFLK